jgi:hypothetical protein
LGALKKNDGTICRILNITLDQNYRRSMDLTEKEERKEEEKRRKCNSWCGGWKKWTCLIDLFIGPTNYTRHRGSASLVDRQRAQAESAEASPELAAAR